VIFIAESDFSDEDWALTEDIGGGGRKNEDMVL
jgi:hypothetical protein